MPSDAKPVRRHHGHSRARRNLAKSPPMTKGSRSRNRPVSSVLRDNRDVLLYRCHFEPRRTLDYIDAKSPRLRDDAGGGFPSAQGQALDDWIHPLDRERTWNAVEEAVRAQRSYLLVYRLVGAGNKDKWVWDEGEAFKTGDGRIAGLEGFLAGI